MFRHVRLTAGPIVVALLTGCAGARASTAPTTASGDGGASPRVVSAASGRTVSFAQMADDAAKADVVFFGEQHDDAETHRAELALLSAIGDRRSTVVLSLEMFERDVQQLLDAYLTGGLSETDFRAQARPWPNYETDYRPLLELAKARHWPVVASNVPRRLASMVSRKGLSAVDTLAAVDRAYVAQQSLCPKDQYYTNFVEVMGGGHGAATAAPTSASPASPMAGMTELFYQAQCIKDETMAESIVRAREKAGPQSIVVHFNGAFHTDFGLGTAARVTRRLPNVKTVVVSAVPTPDPMAANAKELLDRGQYIIIVKRLAPTR
ncbi:MAG: ChaN family lipoprotein [Gemmatimonadaceae bacterium]|nr:ChaN family lipoprotein [Gemmatimonadaceae bacterium]